MKKWIRKFCLWFLKEELDKERAINERNAQFTQRLKEELYEYKKFHVLPKSLFSEILKIIPDPKYFKSQNGCYKLNYLALIKPNPKEGKEYTVNIHMTGVSEDALHIHVEELGIRFNVQVVLNNGSYECFGVMTDISAWFWNFSKSGITIVSDTDFYLITEFMSAQRSVLS